MKEMCQVNGGVYWLQGRVERNNGFKEEVEGILLG